MQGIRTPLGSLSNERRIDARRESPRAKRVASSSVRGAEQGGCGARAMADAAAASEARALEEQMVYMQQRLAKIRERSVSGSDHFESRKSQSEEHGICLLYTSPSPRGRTRSRMPSSA